MAIKPVLHHLNYTKAVRLTLHTRANAYILIYTDTNFAGDLTNQKSTSGITINALRLFIHLNRIKQSIVVLSMTDTEFVASAKAKLEMQLIILLLNEIAIVPEIVVYYNNDQ